MDARNGTLTGGGDAVAILLAEPAQRRRCVAALGVTDTRTLARGLRVLSALL